MKKLFILILASLFCVGLFAAPKIPKTDNFADLDNALSYINTSCQNIYYIYSVVFGVDDDYIYELWFRNHSYITDVDVLLVISFPNETSLDNYIETINTVNLETEFDRIRNSLLNDGIQPEKSTFLGFDGYMYYQKIN